MILLNFDLYLLHLLLFIPFFSNFTLFLNFMYSTDGLRPSMLLIELKFGTLKFA